MDQSDASSRRPSTGSRAVSVLQHVALSVVAVALLLALLELAFRAAPALLPQGSYGAGRFDPDLDANVHGGRAIYNKVRLVVRDPNPDGFMDVAHEREKPAGVVRVGFYGDSYVEALQVPLEQVFFRRLPERLPPELRVETLGFGISGWGTLHAKRASLVYGDRYDVDLDVYVFVENDLGDQMWSLAAHRESAGSTKPFLDPADGEPGYRLRSVASRSELPFWFGAAKLVQRSSFLAQAVLNRLSLLSQGGVQVRRDERDVEMSAAAGVLPDPNDLPGTWPRRHAELAMRLGEIVLREWRDAAIARGRTLVVLYVPRGHEQLDGTIDVDATWLPWLSRTCAALGIPLVDPSEALARSLADGVAVYDDHFSPAGHEIVADEIAAWIAANVDPARR